MHLAHPSLYGVGLACACALRAQLSSCDMCKWTTNKSQDRQHRIVCGDLKVVPAVFFARCGLLLVCVRAEATTWTCNRILWLTLIYWRMWAIRAARYRHDTEANVRQFLRSFRTDWEFRAFGQPCSFGPQPMKRGTIGWDKNRLIHIWPCQ